MPTLPPSHLIDREAIRRGGLREFIKRAWPIVESGRFIDNWHIGFLCEHLEAVQTGEIKRLIINIPPSCMKSRTVSIMFPAWLWTIEPEKKFIFATYDALLSDTLARAHRDIVLDPWYQQRWPAVQLPRSASLKARFFQNTAGGFRFSTTVAGGVTGRHSHIQCVDDPIKPKDTKGGADSTRKMLQRADEWWSGTMSTRAIDPSNFVRIIMMQRLHDADLAGLELHRGGYAHVMLPMRYEPSRACKTVWGGPKGEDEHVDPRTVPGELLWPERFPEAAVKAMEIELRGDAAAQLQQDPVPATGGLFKREWLGHFWSPNGEIPDTIPLPVPGTAFYLQSWDMAFKGTETSDYVAGGVWCRAGARFFLLDQVRAKLTFTETLTAMRTLTAKHPKAIGKLIEDKANGPAVADAAQRDIPGIELVTPEGGKEARANAVSPLFSAGNVILPHPALPGMSWVHDYIEEFCRFPKGVNDDQVDQTTQALLRLYVKTSRLVEAMARLRADGQI